MSDAGPPKAGGDEDEERRFQELKRQYLPSEKSTGNELASVGIELGLTVVVLAIGGWWVDKKLGTTPWLTLVGCFVGIVGGLVRLVKKATRK
jgi:F0F1-type ATP synthase assembly protein I